MRPRRVNPLLLERARAMRHESAPAEEILWAAIRNRQLEGFKFRRQFAILQYVVDFYCAEAKLVVELDGDSHSEQIGYDAKRTEELGKTGLEVLRFENPDVFDHTELVLEKILDYCLSRRAVLRSAPHPDPLPVSTRGEGKR
jgi:very-short-patch-repair endonuclease